MERKEDIKWTNDMIEKYEELLTCIPAQARKFVGKNILSEIARMTRMRGLDTVDTSAIVNGFLVNTPVFFKELVERKMYEIGFDPKLYEKEMPKRDVEQLKADIVEFSDNLGLKYDEDSINQMVDLFAEQFAYVKAPISFRTTTKENPDLSYRFVNLFLDYDPYKMAIENKLIVSDGHKIYKLIKEFQEKKDIQGYGVDFSVKNGLEKIWIYIPFHKSQEINDLAVMDNAPKSLEYNLKFFKRFDFKEYYIVGLDFKKKSMNVYFMTNRMPKLTADMIRNMLTELGMKNWTDQLVELSTKAMIIYFTITWDTLRIERVCFGITEDDLNMIPYYLNPLIKKYVDLSPTLGDSKKFIYGITFGRNMNYYKIENDYSDSMVNYLRGVHSR